MFNIFFNNQRISTTKPFKAKANDKKGIQNKNEKENTGGGSKNYTTAQLSSCALANVTYKSDAKEKLAEFKKIVKENKLSYYIPDDFYSKFDYKNINRHIDNLLYLISAESDMGNGTVFENGYFYSEDGVEAFDILKKNYSTKKIEHYRDTFSVMLEYTPEQILKAKERNLFDGTLKTINSPDYKKVKELIELSDEQFYRLKKSGLMEEGINYASDNDYVNQMFVGLQHSKKDGAWTRAEFETLDELLLSLNDEDKIKDTAEKITKIENKKLLRKILEHVRYYDKSVDIEFLAGNLDELYNHLHSSIPNFKDTSFFSGVDDILLLINKDNKEASKNLAELKGVNQHLFYSVLGYMHNKENADHVQNLIDEIKAGKEDIIALPVYKYAQINERILKAKNSDIKEYDKNADLSEIEKQLEQGEIFFHGDDVYINSEKQAEKLNIDKNMYKKLFPKYKSLCVRQGEGTRNCYFLSGGLIAFWKNPKAREHLLKMIRQEGNDIVVTIPAFKKYPVRFKNGEIKTTDKSADTSVGNLILEQAYAKAKYAKSKNIKEDPSLIDADTAMDYIGGGFESDVYNELLGCKKAKEYINTEYMDLKDRPNNHKYIRKENIPDILDKYSDLNKYIVGVSTAPRDEGTLLDYGIHPRHAYAVENIDTKNKTITVINPGNSLYTSTLSYEKAKELFNLVSVVEV